MQFYTFVKNIDKILASFNSQNVQEGETLNLFSIPKQSDNNAIQQNIFTQAIKETVEDKELEYIVINQDNLKSTLDDISNSDCIGIRYYFDNDDEISHISISNGKNYFFAKDYIDNLKPIIESEKIKKITYDAKSDYRYLLNLD